MMPKIVIDTSVLISALIGKHGPGREILRQCLLGKYKPLISNALFQEYEDVSGRKNIVNLCPLSKSEIRELLNAYYNVCHWVPIYYLWRPNLRDENDNFLIELALAGNSNLIITNNVKNLLGAELVFEGLKILTPEVFLRGQ
jgi:putative PIN family toxin of toxin-antitoxin system